MFSLTNRGQLGGLVAGVVTVAIVMMILAMLAITADKTKKTIDDNCVNSTGIGSAGGAPGNQLTINCSFPDARSTLDNLTSGTKDSSDMGKILLFAIPAIAVLGLFIGLTRLA